MVEVHVCRRSHMLCISVLVGLCFSCELPLRDRSFSSSLSWASLVMLPMLATVMLCWTTPTPLFSARPCVAGAVIASRATLAGQRAAVVIMADGAVDEAPVADADDSDTKALVKQLNAAIAKEDYAEARPAHFPNP